MTTLVGCSHFANLLCSQEGQKTVLFSNVKLVILRVHVLLCNDLGTWSTLFFRTFSYKQTDRLSQNCRTYFFVVPFIQVLLQILSHYENYLNCVLFVWLLYVSLNVIVLGTYYYIFIVLGTYCCMFAFYCIMLFTSYCIVFPVYCIMYCVVYVVLYCVVLLYIVVLSFFFLYYGTTTATGFKPNCSKINSIHLLTCKLNSPEANYKASTRGKEK
jgi:hypothetical protein